MPASSTYPGCAWSRSRPDYIAYHDKEWGTPVYSDRHMFEHLLLETFQAGLSWLLILRRRSAFRAAFHSFDPSLVAAMTEADVDRLAQDASIVRNRAKIRAAIANARAVVEMRDGEGVGLAEYFWRWVGFLPVDNCLQTEADIPSSTELSERISRDLKRRGFRFVGPTVVYAHLQSTGIVNDHVEGCPRHQAAKDLVRGQRDWLAAGVDVGVMGDASAVWEKAERDAMAAKPNRKRKESKPAAVDRVPGRQEQNGKKRRRSMRLAGAPS